MDLKQRLIKKVVDEATRVSGIRDEVKLAREKDKAWKLYDLLEYHLLPGFEIDMWHNLGVCGCMNSEMYRIYPPGDDRHVWTCYKKSLHTSETPNPSARLTSGPTPAIALYEMREQMDRIMKVAMSHKAWASSSLRGYEAEIDSYLKSKRGGSDDTEQ